MSARFVALSLFAITALTGCGGKKSAGNGGTAAPTTTPEATPVAKASSTPLFPMLTEKVRKDAQDSVDAITAAQEVEVGQGAAILLLRRSGGLVLEKDLVEYVNEVANRVGQQGERKVLSQGGVPRLKARRFVVGVVADARPNAWSLPGGYIFVSSGLLEKLTCESDLAWVLGHEIAHIDHEHGLAALKLAARTSSIIGGDASLDDRQRFERMAEKVVEKTMVLGFDLEQERLADKVGLQYAVAAGYDGDAANRVLRIMESVEAAPKSLKAKVKTKLFVTHETPAARRAILAKAPVTAEGRALGVERYDLGAIVRLESAATVAELKLLFAP